MKGRKWKRCLKNLSMKIQAVVVAKANPRSEKALSNSTIYSFCDLCHLAYQWSCNYGRYQVCPAEERRIVKFWIGLLMVPEERSPMQTIAVICIKLDQGESGDTIREYLDIEDDLFTFCVGFALENNLIIKQEDRYEITIYGKEFVSAF